MWMETQPSAQSSFQKLNAGSSSQKARKIRHHIFEALFNFTVFPTLCQIFWQGL